MDSRKEPSRSAYNRSGRNAGETPTQHPSQPNSNTPSGDQPPRSLSNSIVLYQDEQTGSQREHPLRLPSGVANSDHNFQSPLESKDILRFIFTFVGSGSFRNVGATNRIFHMVYLQQYSNETSLETAFGTQSMARLATAEEPRRYTGEFVTNWIAYYGNTDAMEWASRVGYPLSALTLENACAGGNLEILKWLRALSPPCPWGMHGRTVFACTFAAMWGRLNVLEWLREQRPPCPWSADTCAMAAAAGHLNVLIWLRAQRPPCPWNTETCSNAASAGHLQVLIWLREQRPPCPWRGMTCVGAARNGHLDVLEWICAQRPPCPWNDEICPTAAFNGHLDVLILLRAQNPPCPWCESTCLEAASGGHLNVLQWLRAQDPPCPWDAEECIRFALSRRLYDVVRWIREQEAL